MFVCADGTICEYVDDRDAIDAACTIALHHARVGLGDDESTARRCAARALPGMVVCPRRLTGAVETYPLTATTAFVRSSPG